MRFEIENLSSGQADCFLVQMENDYDDKCTILIDGNREGKKSASLTNIVDRIDRLEKLDYIVITHVDNDHLGGILSLYERGSNAVPDISQKIAETVIVYNYVSQGEISYRQARTLESLLRGKRVMNSFSQRNDNNGSMLKFLQLSLRRILEFTDGRKQNAYFTFLGPSREGAYAVVEDCRKCRITGKKEESELINKNSITFLLEFGGKKVLFLGDAFLPDVKEALCTIENPKSPLKIDLIKLPHHGSKENNVGIGDFAASHQCVRFIATAKGEWDNKHPDQEVIKQLYQSGRKITIYSELDLSQIDNAYKDMSESKERVINII